MAKKLSMSKVKESNKLFQETTTLPFEDDIEVVLFPYFSPTKINEMLTSLRDDLIGFDKHGINLDDDLFVPYVLYKTCIAFTDISSPQKDNYDKEENYYKSIAQFFKELINTHYFKEITDTFIDSEVGKVFDKLVEIQVANERLEREMKKMQQQIKNLDLQSPELKNRIQKQIPEV